MKKIVYMIVAVLFTLPCLCQVEGEVVDEQNKAVLNTMIIATDTARKTVDTVRVDDRGFYFFKGLKPGVHKFEAKATGFLSTIQFFKVNAAPEGANETDDTYFAETLDFILKRSKAPK